MLDRRYDYLYVDVGGGSTEISLISGGVLQAPGRTTSGRCACSKGA